MNSYLVLPLVQAVFCLVLAIVVLHAQTRSINHRLFALFLFGLAIWGVVIFGMRSSHSVEQAYLWEKWLTPLAPITAAIFYHFSVRYRHATGKVRFWPVWLVYGISLVFIPLAIFNLVFTEMQVKAYGYAPVFGPAILAWVLFNYVVYVITLMNFINLRRNTADVEQRNRAAYIVIGMAISLVGGAFDLLPVLGLPLYPGVIFGNIAFASLTAIAILKYNLLDIRIVLRKSSAYALISTIMAAPLIGGYLLLTGLIFRWNMPVWGYIILLVILALILPALWGAVERWVDKMFYRERYDYLKALETFVNETHSLTSSDYIDATLVKLIAGAMQASDVYFLQPIGIDGDFATISSTKVNESTPEMCIDKSGLLTRWLERSGTVLSYDDIDAIPQLQNIIDSEREALHKVKARLIIPLKTRTNQLSGIIILGPKVSGESYSLEDRELIFAIATQAAVTLENALLYKESQREIANRKRAESALQESEQRFRRLAENAPDLIYRIRLMPNHCYEYISPAAITMTGYTPEEYYADPDLGFKIIHRDDKEKFERHIKGGIFSTEPTVFRLIRKDDTVIWTEHHNVPIYDESNSVVALEGIARDITERKLAEERQDKLQKELYLSSRLASIGQLAAGVAHEINNPLTGVLGFSERLIRKNDDETVKRDLERIHSEAKRAARVVQNLLTFARRHEPRRELSDVNDILEKTLELRAYELKSENISLEIKLAPNPLMVIVDFSQIQEVFLNIILNAEQAMTSTGGGRKLIVNTEQIDQYIRVSFIDNGPGILSEHLEKLFSPFFTTKEEQGGSGLGLSICYGIVKQHGGKIYATSKSGEGAAFFVELPAAASDLVTAKSQNRL